MASNKVEEIRVLYVLQRNKIVPSCPVLFRLCSRKWQCCFVIMVLDIV